LLVVLFYCVTGVVIVKMVARASSKFACGDGKFGMMMAKLGDNVWQLIINL